MSPGHFIHSANSPNLYAQEYHKFYYVKRNYPVDIVCRVNQRCVLVLNGNPQVPKPCLSPGADRDRVARTTPYDRRAAPSSDRCRQGPASKRCPGSRSSMFQRRSYWHQPCSRFAQPGQHRSTFPERRLPQRSAERTSPLRPWRRRQKRPCRIYVSSYFSYFDWSVNETTSNIWPLY